jgi:hypothetical protein
MKIDKEISDIIRLSNELSGLNEINNKLEKAFDFDVSVLTESHELLFENSWKLYESDLNKSAKEIEIILDKKYKNPEITKAGMQVHATFVSKLKTLVQLIASIIVGSAKITFKYINKLIWYVLKNVLKGVLNPNTWFTGIGAIAGFVLYKTLTGLPLIGGTIETGVETGVASTVSFGWNTIVEFVKSYEPSSVLDPFEIITEALAAFLKFVGIAAPVAFDQAGNLINFIGTSVGWDVTAHIVGYLYITGTAAWLFDRAKEYFSKPINNLIFKNKDVLIQPVQQSAKQLPAPQKALPSHVKRDDGKIEPTLGDGDINVLEELNRIKRLLK